MSQFFTSGDQSIGVSASAPVLPMNIQGRFFFRMDWFDLLVVQDLPTPAFKLNSNQWYMVEHSFKILL